ncbi:hypothetical protein CANCADRAFT_45207 [Tortispora caseinolytica NRRL Y-17796]|uniref:PRMT5 arginine-N-methyltransferase domain-containing protein n=1 Tax=Tortispora caseinolytica NRRL Y-17796 TaxID=767744 RepID=A0A1E4TAM7_9ASCO|nr:hypothetical protein CANCADRAFT_45207 [Tortispora caseinolytica NRRL Y-17796]
MPRSYQMWHEAVSGLPSQIVIKPALIFSKASLDLSATLVDWYSSTVSHIFLDITDENETPFLPGQRNLPALQPVYESLLAAFAVSSFPPVIAMRVHSDALPNKSNYLSAQSDKNIIVLGFPSYYKRVLERQFPKQKQTHLDVLQTPMQPHKQLLTSTMYKTMETDQKKYNMYRAAIASALKTITDRDPEISCISILLIGAGYGHIIDEIMRCRSEVDDDIEFQVVAIERNPVPAAAVKEGYEADYSCLKVLNLDTLKASVRLAELGAFDIIVSELIGSFGDNELCPECLSLPQLCSMKSPDTIMIPSNITTFVEPIYSPLLHSEWTAATRSRDEFKRLPLIVNPDKVRYFSANPEHAQEGTKSVYFPWKGIKPRELWSFGFPQGMFKDPEMPMDLISSTTTMNQRFAEVQWGNESSESKINGFMGYFEAVLYGDIVINNLTGSENCLSSWFPAFFPLGQALTLPENGTLHATFSRNTDSTSVWYDFSAITRDESGSALSERVTYNVDGSHKIYL